LTRDAQKCVDTRPEQIGAAALERELVDLQTISSPRRRRAARRTQPAHVASNTHERIPSICRLALTSALAA